MAHDQTAQKKNGFFGRQWQRAQKLFYKACGYYFKAAVGIASFSLLLQAAPRLVATPLDEHMTEQGYPEKTKDAFFDSKKIYVYDRGNLLVPFHLAGRNIMTEVDNIIHPDPHVGQNAALSLIGGVIRVFAAPYASYSYYHQTLQQDAEIVYAYTLRADQTDVKTRSVFIYPPANTDARTMIEKFGVMNTKYYTFKSDEKKLADIFYKFIMYHESRHGDQFPAHEVQNECDADLYALDMLKKLETDKTALDEFTNILVGMRATRGLVGDHSHASAMTIVKNDHNPDNQLRYAQACERLHEWVGTGLEMNKDFFDQDAAWFGSMWQRTYYLVSGLMDSGTLTDRDMVEAANAYIASCEYFSRYNSGSFHTYSAEYIKKSNGTDLSQIKIPEYPLRPLKSPSPAAP